MFCGIYFADEETEDEVSQLLNLKSGSWQL